MKEKTEVIKHSSAIQIENSISLLQRKAWNILFANAYDELPREEIHHVNVQELVDVLGYKSTNHQHLKESIKALVTTGVEWNVLDKDKEEEWGVTTLLAQAKIKSGVCTYAYSPEMRGRLHNPAMYARISLELQNRFSSKHALALFELFQDYFDESRQFGETPFIEIPRFRKLMGIPDEKYLEFKILNKWVIKDPIKEIQNVTDYVIDVEYKRQGRKVVAVKFKAQRVLQIPTNTRQGELFIDTEGLPDIVAMLVKIGVHHNKAMKVWSDGFRGVKNRPKGGQPFDDYVQEKIDLLQQETAKGKVDGKAAWLIAAIRDNYEHADYQKRKRAGEIKERITELETEAKRLEREMGRRDAEIFEPLFANDEILQSAFENAQQDSVFKHEWNSYAGNIRAGMEQSEWFKATLRIRIKEQHLEKFNELDKYLERMQEVEAEIRKHKASLRK